MGNGGIGVAVRDIRTLFNVGATGALSDKQLLDRFVDRREATVFEAIVCRHGPMVWGVCRRVLRDHHDAEDAFQATFLVLARRATSIMPREKLGHWLHGVAFQTARKARAMRAKRRGREGHVPEIADRVAVVDDPRDELAESLDLELSRLPEKYRISIVLCELEGMSHKEAAGQLGWPIGTVSSRLSRARSLLAKRLRRRGLSVSAGSLAALLAQESASAAMPIQLIGSTAEAACFYAVGGAGRAGVVSAGVAALTREGVKMMLLSKLKMGVVMFLVASAAAASGTGLAFQAQTIKPDQKDDLQRRIAEKKEELGRLVDEQKREGQPAKAQDVTDAVNSFRGTTAAPSGRNRAIAQGAKEEEQLHAEESLSELILANTPTNAENLEHAKLIIEALIATEKEAKDKSPEELDAMIEEAYWELRVAEARLRRLKAIRETGRSDGPTNGSSKAPSTPFKTRGGVSANSS